MSLLPAVEKALKEGRLSKYRFELCSRTGVFLGTLSSVVGGELTKNAFRAIRTGGTIELSENTSSEIDFLNDRIKIFYCLWVDGEWVEWPLGEFLLASPTRKKSGVMKNRSIEVYDKILILQQDCRDDTFVVPAGTVVTTVVKDVIESTGEKSISMTDSTAETRHDWIWEPGTSALEIVNDLLSSINYFGVWVDGYGSFRVEPYVRLEQRTLVWTFFDDSESLYTPEISVDEDFFFIPNKVILVCSDPETEISASAVNVDPKSPFSYQNRGRWITDYREGEEASSAEVLEEKAKRILEQSMQVVEKVEIQHPWLPIEVNDAVMFRNSDLTLSSRYSVVEQKISLSATELVNTVLRRIVLYE